VSPPPPPAPNDQSDVDRPAPHDEGGSLPTALVRTAIPTEGSGCPCPLADLTGVAETSLVLDVTRTATPGAVHTLRDATRRWVSSLDFDTDTAEDVVLLVDEAVTNVVEHACQDHHCRVHLIARPRPCGTGWAVQVSDDGQWLPPPNDPGFRGRGVQLIGRLAHRSTITTGEGETTVNMCWSAEAPR
jgi:serine/threonine-protein kinase RsbW